MNLYKIQKPSWKNYIFLNCELGRLSQSKSFAVRFTVKGSPGSKRPCTSCCSQSSFERQTEFSLSEIGFRSGLHTIGRSEITVKERLWTRIYELWGKKSDQVLKVFYFSKWVILLTTFWFLQKILRFPLLVQIYSGVQKCMKNLLSVKRRRIKYLIKVFRQALINT